MREGDCSQWTPHVDAERAYREDFSNTIRVCHWWVLWAFAKVTSFERIRCREAQFPKREPTFAATSLTIR